MKVMGEEIEIIDVVGDITVARMDGMTVVVSSKDIEQDEEPVTEPKEEPVTEPKEEPVTKTKRSKKA